MREVRSPRRFGLKDGMRRIVRDRPINLTFGPAGEAPEDGVEEDATAEWLAHVQAGRIGNG